MAIDCLERAFARPFWEGTVAITIKNELGIVVYYTAHDQGAIPSGNVSGSSTTSIGTQGQGPWELQFYESGNEAKSERLGTVNVSDGQTVTFSISVKN